MRKRIAYFGMATLVGVAAVAALVHARGGGNSGAGMLPAKTGKATVTISAAGKVEPVSEEVKLGSQVSGILRSVPVEEGQTVRRGAVIAVVDNAEFSARVEEARATVGIRQAALDRIVNGARDQERREAAASVEEARAVLENDRAEMGRKKSLFESGDVSRSEWERAEREAKVAEARVAEAEQHSSFIDAPARTDEKSRLEADLKLAQAAVIEAEALLEKTIVRAPFDGTVLKRYHKAGEAVSDKGGDPIVSFGDDSRLRVRMDVDETDVAQVGLGARAYVTAQAFGAERFWGRVVRIGSELGKKNVDTGDPGDKVDTKVLETLIELDGHPPLPPGLRVDAFVMTPVAAGKEN